MMKNVKALIGRAILLILCLVMVIPIAACGTKHNDKIVMTLLTNTDVVPADMERVEEAINAKLKSHHDGIEVKLKPISYSKLNTLQTKIAGGDQIDLVCFLLSDPASWAKVNLIQKLTEAEIRENAPDIAAIVDKGTELYVKDASGNNIAISTIELPIFSGGSYIIRKSDLTQAGLADKYTDQMKITISDLDEIMSAVKANNPDSYPSGNIRDFSDASGYLQAFDELASGRQTGVLDLESDMNSTTVVNYFETPAYKNYVNKMKAWRTAGYVHPSATSTPETMSDLWKSGVIRGIYLDGAPGLPSGYSTQAGEEVVQLHIVEPYYKRGAGAGAGISWGIGGTSKNKTNALKFLNAMLTDVDVMNYLQWGIEGRSYEFVDKENGIIKYPDGVNSTNNPYEIGAGVFGDKSKLFARLGFGQNVADVVRLNNLQNTMAEKAQKDRASKGVGFTYDTSAMSAEIAAINNVLDTYEKAVGAGSGDYDAFIKGLKAAGIDKVIADKQAKFDAWRNAK